MIKLGLETAIFLYLLISIFGFLGAWIIFPRIKAAPKNSANLRAIWQCSICTYFYVDSKNPKISVCPRCNSYNQR